MNEHIKIGFIFKCASAILCMIGFVANSFMIFKQFIEHKTVTSQDIQQNMYLFLPSMTICSLSGFKDKMDGYDDIELENYLQNTLALDEILVDVTDTFENTSVLQEMYENSTLWKITTTYSPFKGRCHTIKYNQEVKKLNIFISYATTH